MTGEIPDATAMIGALATVEKMDAIVIGDRMAVQMEEVTTNGDLVIVTTMVGAQTIAKADAVVTGARMVKMEMVLEVNELKVETSSYYCQIIIELVSIKLF
jgi:hypothetical protein